MVTVIAGIVPQVVTVDFGKVPWHETKAHPEAGGGSLGSNGQGDGGSE